MRQVQTQNALSGPSTPIAPSTTASPVSKPTTKAPVQAKKGVKSLLKGVVVKKKDPPAKPQTPTTPVAVPGTKSAESEKASASSPSKPAADTASTPSTKPLPVRIGFAAANEAPKRKRIGLANDYGDSSDEESDGEVEGDQKKQKTT